MLKVWHGAVFIQRVCAYADTSQDIVLTAIFPWEYPSLRLRACFEGFCVLICVLPTILCYLLFAYCLDHRALISRRFVLSALLTLFLTPLELTECARRLCCSWQLACGLVKVFGNVSCDQLTGLVENKLKIGNSSLKLKEKYQRLHQKTKWILFSLTSRTVVESVPTVVGRG